MWGGWQVTHAVTPEVCFAAFAAFSVKFSLAKFLAEFEARSGHQVVVVQGVLRKSSKDREREKDAHVAGMSSSEVGLIPASGSKRPRLSCEGVKSGRLKLQLQF